MSRPEHQAPPEIFYNMDEAKKYASNTRMMDIQTQMTERALELLLLDDGPNLLLDVGCGSGISGETLSENGHIWVGFDISPAMLEIAVEREVEGDTILADAGQMLRFRPGTFDGAVSISVLQWLCNIDKKGHDPFKRLRAFFQALYTCLKKGARAALQFYPETAGQVEMITAAALRCGFGGGLVVDYPHSSKAKKHFLVIYAGMQGNIPQRIPEGLKGEVDEENDTIAVGQRERLHHRKGKQTNRREYIAHKKESQRKRGLTVQHDSKYTGRRRGSNAF